MTQTSVIPKARRNSLGQLKGEFYSLQKAELLALRKTKPINNAAFVYLALRLENPQGDRSVSIKIKKFALRRGILKSSEYKTLTKINRAGGDLVVEIKSPVRVEHKIRTRLQFQLRELTKVPAPANRIDLLTTTEIIEVKHLSEWISALAQKKVAYSGFGSPTEVRINCSDVRNSRRLQYDYRAFWKRIRSL